MPAVYVYCLVGLLVFGESAMLLGLVLPGETVLLAGAALAGAGHATLIGVMGVGLVAAIAGDCLGYAFGRTLGPRIRTSAMGRRVGEARWRRAEQLTKSRGVVAIVGGRWVGVLRSLVPLVSGMNSMPLRTYLICNVVGGVVWVAGVSTFGYFAGTTLGASAMLTVSGGLLGAAAVYALGNWVLRVRRRAADSAKGVPS